MSDYFAFMGFPRELTLDEGKLQQKYYELSRQYHPDFHTQGDEQARQQSLAGRPRRAVPIGRQRRGELRLAFQDGAVFQGLQAIGGQRGAGGGDVHDRFGGSCGGRAFGGAPAFHDAIIADADLRKIAARQLSIFGGDPKAPAMPVRKGGADIIQVRHGRNVDPILRHRHHHIGETESQRTDQMDAAVQFRCCFAQQILAGDAQMDITRQ